MQFRKDLWREGGYGEDQGGFRGLLLWVWKLL